MNKKKILHSFFLKNFISYMVLISLVFLLIYFFAQGTMRDIFIERLKIQLNQVGVALKPKTIELFKENNWKALDNLAKRVGREAGVRITIIAADGTVIADSEKNPLEMENHGDRPEILRALRGEEQVSTSTRFSTTFGERMLYLGLPIEQNGSVHLVIRLSLFFKDIRELIGDKRGQLLAALFILFTLALLLAWYFSRSISKPVREITTATRQFAKGNFDVKIFLKKNDELAEVAESFNSMVSEQKLLFNSLSENRAELQTIISSMKEGLMVLDTEGKITLCNESFEKIVNKNAPEGLAYWEVLRVPDFEKYVKDALQSENSFYQEVEFNDKTYTVGFNKIIHERKQKLVTTFRDISGFKQLEKIKKDFVINLTHELKTPLTAIKGFVETLEAEENIKNNNYMEIIKRHTERMIQLVSDLLILSELEEENRQVHFEKLDLAEIVNNIIIIFKDKIKEKSLRLELDIQDKTPKIYGEQFKIEQMIINLIDNAVKYTEKGKITIIIGPSDDGKYVNIQIINTGSPIPEISIPRIFERFYVVDKSRSRNLGGTGLGLSIVKHVAILHKGNVDIVSNEKEGNVFTIRLPTVNNKSSIHLTKS